VPLVRNHEQRIAQQRAIALKLHQRFEMALGVLDDALAAIRKAALPE
jgi:hypothetical protein